jgi:hypothetical protein
MAAAANNNNITSLRTQWASSNTELLASKNANVNAGKLSAKLKEFNTELEAFIGKLKVYVRERTALISKNTLNLKDEIKLEEIDNDFHLEDRSLYESTYDYVFSEDAQLILQNRISDVYARYAPGFDFPEINDTPEETNEQMYSRLYGPSYGGKSRTLRNNKTKKSKSKSKRSKSRRRRI